MLIVTISAAKKGFSGPPYAVYRTSILSVVIPPSKVSCLPGILRLSTVLSERSPIQG